MNILEEIIQFKRKEVSERKKLTSIEMLEKGEFFDRENISLKQALSKIDSSGIIAEFKRKSPSKGIINNSVEAKQVTSGYVKAGATALSVLTDEKFFGGINDDLIKARIANFCPILRKDFIVDEYQIIEAKSIGSDVILLIAACLSKTEIHKFTKFAKSLNLEVLLELHDEDELQKIIPEIDLIGINNRNLKNFKVDLEYSKKLAEKVSGNFIKITESGIDSPSTIKELKNYGFKGFLIGEHFMKSLKPELACEDFIKQLM